jgi:hypothetical protein
MVLVFISVIAVDRRPAARIGERDDRAFVIGAEDRRARASRGCSQARRRVALETTPPEYQTSGSPAFAGAGLAAAFVPWR